ncbi:MAG: hypothetical protein EB141_17205, partial [Verrucomicrobia bacterium]|nr:hypothetical protein [Verrucomicrobiota bacterium]
NVRRSIPRSEIAFPNIRRCISRSGIAALRIFIHFRHLGTALGESKQIGRNGPDALPNLPDTHPAHWRRMRRSHYQ